MSHPPRAAAAPAAAAPRPAQRSRDGIVWLVSIVLVAVNLRPVIASVPPLVDHLSAVFGLSSVAAGALTTLPVVCMGLLAPTAAVAARRVGETTVLAAAVGLIAIGAAARAVGGLAGLYSGTALAGVGIAIAGTLLPGFVRARTPDRVGPVTGIYTATIIFGALLASGTTEPLRAAFGWSPQHVLAVWAIPATIALIVWLATQRVPASRADLGHSDVSGSPATSLCPRSASGTADGGPAATRGMAGEAVNGGPWRSRRAWLATLFMGGQSLLFYGTLAWLAPLYIGLGMSAPHAGLLLALFSATQVVTALAMPVLGHRGGNPRPWIAMSVGLTILGLALVAAVPNIVPAAPWLWACVLGLGMGGNLSLALTEVTRAAPTPAAVPSYSGMAFFVGYLLAAVGPVAAGALRDATGGFAAVFATLAVLGLGTLAAALATTYRSTDRRSGGGLPTA